jgi:IS30 family transposase
VQALFQIKVWVDEADGFNAFWGLRQGRKKMGRVANSVRSLLPAVWPVKAALRLLSRVAVIDLLQPLAECLHTITADNGKEFAEHQRIVQELGIDFFFAHPYAAWERGSNENMNGRLRQYFPKGRDFGIIYEKEIDDVM